MFAQLIVLSFLFPYCLMIKNNSYGICQKVNLCRKKNEPCHPVVMKCQNGSCRYRRYNMSDNRSIMFSRWYYDTNYQRCRRYNNHIENFVYFRFLRHCKRLCPVIQEEKRDKIVTLHISETPPNYNETLYIHLHIDLSPAWLYNLTDQMNISTDTYRAQAHYFQNYRRRFVNFMDSTYQLMLNHQQNIQKKNYT